ncbi:MAG: type II toxin-antitoxin system RelE/ParE family toxin [Alphaproteobacteria bacterium]|nr:type II toxin-antitoxin system RelE/ParE family toxin [Alphaproteobacteria bacterium]
MPRGFKTRGFARWARKAGLSDAALWAAIGEMSRGLIDAQLGGGLVKKRVALPGRGKRGSARTIVATNRDDRWFFVYGFAKNEASDVSPRELAALKALAADLLALSPSDLDGAGQDAIVEIIHDQAQVPKPIA